MTDWTPVSPGDPPWTPADVENSDTQAAASAAAAAASAAEAAASVTAAADSATSAQSSATSATASAADAANALEQYIADAGTTGTGKFVLDASPTITAPAIVGGAIGGLTSFGLRSSGAGAFDLQIINTEDLTAARTLNIALNNAARVINLAGNLKLDKNFTTAGAYNLILTQTADTNVTLPAIGTLATLGGSETFTNKTLTSPVVTGAPTGPGFLFGVSQGSLPSSGSLVTSITAGLAVIKGIGSGGYQFIDVVLYAFFGTPTVIASIALNAPAARTYAPDSGGALKISLVSDAQAPYTITSTQMLS